MDLYQLKTFVAVAREGSITRAAELVHLSQPAVSAHIKELEDALGLSLFERTPRGMSLTRDGQRLLAKAEQTLAAHQELLDEAARSKGQVAGKLRLGAGTAANAEAVGRLLTTLAERFPAVEVAIEHGTSAEVLAGLRNGKLDAGFYNEPDETPGDLAAVEVARFKVFLVGAPGTARDWPALAAMAWVYPTASACCSRAAESLFKAHKIRPARVISVDRPALTRTLIASGLGVGLLHADAALEAEDAGEVEPIADSGAEVRTLFAQLATRARDPVLATATSIIRAGQKPSRAR
jgi:molybdate transport repressor ModE-like protein